MRHHDPVTVHRGGFRVGTRYTAISVLGRGGFGTVWRGEGPDGELVAIKLLHPHLIADAAVVARLVRERLALTRLSHPHVVQARDLVVDGDVVALVMDLVEGPSLRMMLDRQGSLPPGETIRLGAQISSALTAAHAAGIVHRDLKPANILLDTTSGLPSVRVADLGIAAVAGDRTVTATGEVLGTSSYVAPEAIRGQAVTPAADIYALGVMVYEMCTGRPPFAAETVEAVLHQHLNTPPRRPDEIPSSLWTIVAQCLDKSPERRPAAAQLAQRLSALHDGRVLAVASPGGEIPHPRRGMTRRLLHPDSPPDTPTTAPRPLVRRWRPLALAALVTAVATIAFAAAQVLPLTKAGRQSPDASAPSEQATASLATASPATWHVDVWPYDVIANGLGPVERGMSAGGQDPSDGGRISIGGTAYVHGIGVHAYSHVRVSVYGACQRFYAKVGVDDQAAAAQAGSVVITILADGETQLEEALTWQSGVREIDLVITGRQIIDLVVSDASDGAEGDVVSWADARFEGCSG